EAQPSTVGPARAAQVRKQAPQGAGAGRGGAARGRDYERAFRSFGGKRPMTTEPTRAGDQAEAPYAGLVSMAAAVRLLPSCRPGKRMHISTLYRWISEGRLSCWKIGRWRYVSRAELLALVKPAGRARAGPAAGVPRVEERRQQAAQE